jgi:hypothetical protein
VRRRHAALSYCAASVGRAATGGLFGRSPLAVALSGLATGRGQVSVFRLGRNDYRGGRRVERVVFFTGAGGRITCGKALANSAFTSATAARDSSARIRSRRNSRSAGAGSGSAFAGRPGERGSNSPSAPCSQSLRWAKNRDSQIPNSAQAWPTLYSPLNVCKNNIIRRLACAEPASGVTKAAPCGLRPNRVML